MNRSLKMTYTVELLTVEDDYARARAASVQLSGRTIIPQYKGWTKPRQIGRRPS